MATLISPGVSVPVTDESFYVPASATTVPLIILATASEKRQANGIDLAAGTFESNVVRTVTSIAHSTRLYGIPRFLTNDNGESLHGDPRNEYGLFALNQFLGIGNMAYVVRADINLDDDITAVRNTWNRKIQEAGQVAQYLTENLITRMNSTRDASSPVITEVDLTDAIEIVKLSLESVWRYSSFAGLKSTFISNSNDLDVFGNGFDTTRTGVFVSIIDDLNKQAATSNNKWTSDELKTSILTAASAFSFTRLFAEKTSLGLNNSQRRDKIVQALNAVIQSNQDIRSENLEFNLVLCPGFYEVAPTLLSLRQDLEEEVFVIGDTPMDLDPEELVSNWVNGFNSNTGSAENRFNPLTVRRQANAGIAYYYPHGIAPNLDGRQVAIPSSGIALRTYAYSDNQQNVWWAPAGTQRGTITGVTDIGYVETGFSTPRFVTVQLNRGQRDNLYKVGTAINPIVNSNRYGMYIFGQKTTSPVSSAMDRVNVVRLVCKMKRDMRTASLPYVFQPNDQTTRDNFKTMHDSYLLGLMTQRALYDFVTLCDKSNNTAQRIDRNELWLDVAIKPTKVAEFIYIPIRVLNTGATLNR